MPRPRLLRIAVCVAVMSAPHLWAQTPIPLAVDGVITLDGGSLDRGVPLAGQWEFQWGSFTVPGGTRLDARRAVPGLWSSGEEPHPAAGHATYRLVIELPRGAAGTLGLYLNKISTAYRLYVNGRLLAEAGLVSEIPEAVRGQLAPRTVYFAAAERLELVLHVANGEDVVAGINAAPVLGYQAAIAPLQLRLTLVDALVYAAVFVMGLYHVLLSLLHPDEKASRYFGLLALDLSLRGLLTGSRMLQQLVGEIGFHTWVATEYVTVYLGLLLVYLYFHHLFPEERPRFLRIPLTAITAVFVVFVAVAPIRVISPVHLGYEVFLLAVGVLILIWLVRALVHRRAGAGLLLAGFVVLLGGAVYDVVVDVLDTGGVFLSAYAMLAFILLQAVLIALRYAYAFHSAREHSNRNEALAKAYGRFVPRELLSLLGKESIVNVELGDQVEMDMTVLFADIRSFTTMSERMTPRENFNFLNSFLERISPVIRSHNGFIDKYLGDGIMALFPSSPADALRAAAAMLATLKQYNQHRAASGYEPIFVGIGVNTGRLMLGTVGETFRMEGTVISDVVNMASRLQTATKTFGVHVLVSDAVLHAAPDTAGLAVRYLGRARLKGKTRSVGMYELIDPEETVRIRLRKEFEVALRAFDAREYGRARSGLEAVLGEDPTDPASRYYLGRLTELTRGARG